MAEPGSNVARVRGSRRADVLVMMGLVLSPIPATAQVWSSEAGSVSQTVDGTVVTIEYSRPVARGRDSLIGGVVHWGRVWTPGANWATTLEASADIRLNGQPVAPGKYSVWIELREDSTWSFILHPDARRFHSQPPGPEDGEEALRLEVTPRVGSHMETLVWYFPFVTRGGATLRVHWGEMFVPLRLTVQPSDSITLDVAERQPYLGWYVMTLEPPDDGAEPIAIEIYEDGDRLRVRMDPAPSPDLEAEFDLIAGSARPARDHRFNPGRYHDGTLHDVDAGTTIIFDVQDGLAVGFQMRGLERVLGHAERTQ